MARYICKCGRVVNKSTNADNTGNRDTDGCEGCPYLLPWGPFAYKPGDGYVMDVKGKECRMSPSIDYTSTYYGSADDKCTLRIVSLDLDFLEEMQVWINEHAEGQLSGGFSRDTIRGTDYSQAGRYCWSISCSQNKKGMAAKAALIQRFFDSGHRRLDMTPEEEKAYILAAIEAGKARAQKKEETPLTYRDPSTGWLYRVSQEPFQGSYFVHYLDPKSSVIWKRCTGAVLCAGSLKKEVEEEYLRLNAKRNGWEPVEDDPDANPTQAAPACPADAGAAEQSLSAAAPASLAADPAPAFDYTGLDDQTVADLHLAEREIRNGRKMAEMGLQRMADGVAIAHDALCGSCDNLSQLKHGNRGENTFGAWCESVGLHRKAAERLLQVSKLFDNSTPREQKVLGSLGQSLMYEISKPSAPAELVQAVKDGDITTHKQFKELEAQLKAERQARERAEQRLADEQQAHQAERESTSAMLREEQQRRQAAEERRIAAEKDKAAARQQAKEAQARGKQDAALVEKLQDILLQRDNEVAEQKERADAAELRARQAESRPVEVAVQAPTEEQINAAAKQRTAMLEAQLHTLQTQLDDAEKRADAAANSAYLSAAEFAGQAAAMIDGIRASFWAMAKELPDTDFNQALEPLDRAVSRIYNREWEDGWDDSWENEEDTEL